eukprot:m.34724 g.34724  ORF g.34724 m.34724 type:complete len:393 (-) comp5688_c0_seq1:103-1281(-)
MAAVLPVVDERAATLPAVPTDCGGAGLAEAEAWMTQAAAIDDSERAALLRWRAAGVFAAHNCARAAGDALGGVLSAIGCDELIPGDAGLAVLESAAEPPARLGKRLIHLRGEALLLLARLFQPHAPVISFHFFWKYLARFLTARELPALLTAARNGPSAVLRAARSLYERLVDKASGSSEPTAAATPAPAAAAVPSVLFKPLALVLHEIVRGGPPAPAMAAPLEAQVICIALWASAGVIEQPLEEGQDERVLPMLAEAYTSGGRPLLAADAQLLVVSAAAATPQHAHSASCDASLMVALLTILAANDVVRVARVAAASEELRRAASSAATQWLLEACASFANGDREVLWDNEQMFARALAEFDGWPDDDARAAQLQPLQQLHHRLMLALPQD